MSGTFRRTPGHETDVITKTITQASHGFSVGNAVYYDTTGAAYAKSKADAAATAECEGIVSAVNGNDFTLTLHGWISGLSGLTAGEQYVSPTTAGAMTATEPSTEGHVSKPVMFATSASGGYVNIMRGMVIAGSSVATHASSHYDGGSDEIDITQLAGYSAPPTANEILATLTMEASSSAAQGVAICADAAGTARQGWNTVGMQQNMALYETSATTSTGVRCCGLSSSLYVIADNVTGGNVLNVYAVSISNGVLTVGTGNTSISANSSILDIQALSSSSFVVMYTNSSNKLTLRVGTISGTTTTFGTAVTPDTTYWNTLTFATENHLAVLSSSLFVVSGPYYYGGYYGGACAYTVSGNTITSGSITTTGVNGVNFTQCGIMKLSATEFVLYFLDNNYYPRAVYGSVSTRTITFGTVLTAESANRSGQMCCTLMDSTHFALHYHAGTKLVCLTLSGTTLSAGTILTTATGSCYRRRSVSLSSSSYVSGGTNTLYQFTLSGTTWSEAGSYSFVNTVFNGNLRDILPLSSNSFCVFTDGATIPNTSGINGLISTTNCIVYPNSSVYANYVAVGSVTASTITLDTNSLVLVSSMSDSNSADYIGAALLDSASVCFANTGSNVMRFTGIGKYGGNGGNNFVGTSKASANAGASVSISSMAQQAAYFTGLTAGTKYWYDATGALSTIPVRLYYDQCVYAGQAINTTTISRLNMDTGRMR